jgi:DNA-binding XRE family transcriptional regulator
MDTRPWEKAEIAARFRSLRRKSLLTQKRLSGFIGVGRQAVNRIENRRSMPHEATWNAFLRLESKHNEPEIIFPKTWT